MKPGVGQAKGVCKLDHWRRLPHKPKLVTDITTLMMTVEIITWFKKQLTGDTATNRMTMRVAIALNNNDAMMAMAPSHTVTTRLTNN